MRLIDADKLALKLRYMGYMDEHEEVQEVIDEAPTVEERKKGKWIDAVMFGKLPVQACDQCKTFYPLEYTGGGHNYCPNCGADMRGEEK